MFNYRNSDQKVTVGVLLYWRTTTSVEGNDVVIKVIASEHLIFKYHQEVVPLVVVIIS